MTLHVSAARAAKSLLPLRVSPLGTAVRGLSVAAVLAVGTMPVIVRAQDGPAGETAPPPAGEPAPAEGTEAPPTPADRAEAIKRLKEHLGAIDGPAKGVAVGDEATLDVPAGYWFVPASSAKRFDELMENLSDPGAAGVLVRGELETTIYFTFDAIGYVNDDERDLDADALLATMRENTVAENVERKRQGFDEIEIAGWARAPFYNDTTRSLEWATILKTPGEAGSGSVNYNTRRLGRNGVMKVVLVSSPEVMDAEIPKLNDNLGAFAFVDGKDYASFQQGDRTAEIGLGALVVGGGVALGAKVGFFKKFWKFLAIGGAALVAGIAKLFGRKKQEPEPVVSSDDQA
jgi:uncharacterized membrane-anchored protein